MERKIYSVGKAWKDGKCLELLDEYSNLREAIDNCPKGYKVYNEEGNISYQQEGNKKWLITIFVIVFVLASLSAVTLSVKTYLTSKY